MIADHNRVRELFLAATERPVSERAAYLAENCGINAELRASIDRLLAAHMNPASIVNPIVEPVESGVVNPALPTINSQTPEQEAGTLLAGRYTLLEVIGEGGMGTVWKAQQNQPLKRIVAVKLIKPGMDSKAVLARFEAERQALALMDHPNIARVLDAGVASDGRPFFVMDLVKGKPITQFCDDSKLTPRERLELFLPVCQAIQHAHQKGIIHRDIKPSNVLVSFLDGKAVPKVIDFGVAKAMGQPLSEQTINTGFGTVIGTPQYMSPEQATFNNLDVDTRSDLYSLGVLLYELLVGSPPFAKQELEKAGVLEMLRVVREDEPQKPSTKLSTAEGLPTLAANRSTEPKKLMGILRNELDWIVLKALEKDRTRRYETANGFAADVQRYLSGEPVQAVPPSTSYRLRKFLRKHKGPALGMSVVLLALITAVFGTVYGTIEAGNRRVANLLRKQAEGERDAETRNKVEQAERGVDASIKLATDLRKQFRFQQAKAALVQAEELARKGLPERLAEVEQAQRDLALVVKLDDIRYRKWIWIQLDDGRGKFNTEIAPQEYRKVFAASSLDLINLDLVEAVKRIEASAVKTDLVAAVDDWALYEEEQVLRDRLQELARRVDPNPWATRLRNAASQSDKVALEKLAAEADPATTPSATLVVLAELMRRHGLSPELLLSAARAKYPTDFELAFALGTHRKGHGKNGQEIGPYEAARALRPDLYAVWLNLGLPLFDRGDVDGSIAAFRQAIALEPHYGQAYLGLGIALSHKGDLNGAIAAFKTAITIKPDSARAHFNLGKALKAKGDLDGAITEYKQAIALEPKYAQGHYGLGNVLIAKGNVDGAIAEYKEAIALEPKLAEAYTNLGNVLLLKGEVNDGIKAYRQAIALEPKLAQAHFNLGEVLKDRNDLNGAITEYKQFILLEPNNSKAYYGLGITLKANGDLDGAIDALKEAIRLEPKLAKAHGNLGLTLKDKGDLDGAIDAFKQAIALDTKDARAHYYLGNALLTKEDLDGATREFKQAIALEPKNAQTHTNLASVYLRQKKYADAIVCAHAALKANPKLSSGHAVLGLVLQQTGDLSGARAALTEAARLDKRFAPMLAKLPPVDVAPPPHEVKR